MYMRGKIASRLQKEMVMNTLKYISGYLLGTCLLLSSPLASGAYEVHILTGAGSESGLLNKGDYGAAIERLERSLHQLSAQEIINLTNLCTAYVATGQLEKATPVCDEAVEAGGKYVGAAYNSRGALNALKGDYAAAHADFAQAEDTANYPVARSNLRERTSRNNLGERHDIFMNTSDLNRMLQVAMDNHAKTDEVWAAIKTEDDELLTSVVK